jgi:Mrp family chromosome partitioning ATPase
MSNYFRTLNRLEQEGGARAVSRPQAATLHEVPAPARDVADEPLRQVTNLVTYPGAAHGEHPMAYANLLDSLRAIVHDRAAPAVVIAGASGGGAVARVVKGLAAQARRTGLRLLIAELVRNAGRPALRPLASNGAAAGLDPLEGALPGVQSWLDRCGAGHDLVIVEGPPLDGSVEAALLAKACDGLLLVVESGVTPSESLAKSVELAGAAGCRLLGVVMTGARSWLPPWIRRLFPGPAAR